MTDKQLKEVLKAMMYASGLDPLFDDDDYYQNLNGTTIGQFLEGVVSFFNIKRDSWMVHFCNLEYMDAPSKTLDFFVRHKSDLLGERDE